MIVLKYAPAARPPGFHHAAVASSATAVKAPPIPCARIPTASLICAGARTADTTTRAAAMAARTNHMFFMGSADEDRRRHHRRPEALLIPDCGLGDVLRADDLIGEPVHFLLLVPALVRIEFETERRREHLGGELFGVFASDVLTLAEAVVLGQIAVQLAIPRDRDADGRGDQPVRLARGRFRHHDEGDLSRLEALHALRARQNAALRREDARHANEITGGDTGRAERELERRELFSMLPHTLGEKHLLGHESDHVDAP